MGVWGKGRQTEFELNVIGLHRFLNQGLWRRRGSCVWQQDIGLIRLGWAREQPGSSLFMGCAGMGSGGGGETMVIEDKIGLDM